MLAEEDKLDISQKIHDSTIDKESMERSTFNIGEERSVEERLT